MRYPFRLGVLGFVFLGLLGALVFRLWFLQVAAGATYVDQAERQQVRLVSTPAARGEVRDREGNVLARSRISLSILVDRKLLTAEQEDDVIQVLSALLQVAPVELRSRFDEVGPADRVPVRLDVTFEEAAFVLERADQLPGVQVEPIPVRAYPEASTAAHVVGHVGRPSQQDLDADPTLRGSDTIGKFGLEDQYDELLRGQSGWIKYRVNAGGDILEVIGEQPAVTGADLHLTLDLELQKVLEESLLQGIALSRADRNPATRAAGVVMDPRDGSILAMASLPTFNPEEFVGGLSKTRFDEIQEQGGLTNFALQGRYAPASTFKAVTYVVAVEEGHFPGDLLGPDDYTECPARTVFRLNDGSPQVWRNWKSVDSGPVDLHTALEQSCNPYFWQIALSVWEENKNTPEESLIQEWARLLGFGDQTGIDLPFEAAGLMPDREWFERAQEETPGLVRDSPWAGGDLMNIAIGQGAVIATPLQVAVAYSAMVNGGTVWQPYIVDRAIDPDGEVVFENRPAAMRELDLDPATVASLRADLGRVVNGASGTARAAFQNFGPTVVLVGGKTGTAQVGGDDRANTAWFVGVSPIENPQYVVVIVIEEGGSGGRFAAPVAKRVLQHLLGEQLTEMVPGESSEVSN